MTKLPRFFGFAATKMQAAGSEPNTPLHFVHHFRNMPASHAHRQSPSTVTPVRRSRFPVAEGMGIFLGVIAWDLLSEGYVDLTKALIVTAPVSLGWFALRCWKDRNPHTRDS